MDSTTGSGAAGGMDLRFEADNIIHGPDMCCLLACQEAVTCLQGDLLVAALSECVKAFRRHSTTWSCGWELRRSRGALFRIPRTTRGPESILFMLSFFCEVVEPCRIPGSIVNDVSIDTSGSFVASAWEAVAGGMGMKYIKRWIPNDRESD